MERGNEAGREKMKYEEERDGKGDSLLMKKKVGKEREKNRK